MPRHRTVRSTAKCCKALQSTTIQSTAKYCKALHCTALRWRAKHCKAQHCNAQCSTHNITKQNKQSIAKQNKLERQSKALQSIANPCKAPQSTALQSIAKHCKAKHLQALQSSKVRALQQRTSVSPPPHRTRSPPASSPRTRGTWTTSHRIPAMATHSGTTA